MASVCLTVLKQRKFKRRLYIPQYMRSGSQSEGCIPGLLRALLSISGYIISILFIHIVSYLVVVIL